MTEVHTSTKSNVYDYFIETVEDFNNNIPSNESSQNLNHLMCLKASQQKSTQNLLAYFLNSCNQMNAMESTDSLVSLSTISSRQSMSQMESTPDMLSVFSVFNAMDKLALTSPFSTMDLSAQNNASNNATNNIFYDFFLKLELFLNNSKTEN